MKFVLLSPKNRTVYNFRGDLIKEIKAKGYEVIVTGPDKTDVDKIEALGVRFVEIPVNKTGTSISGDLKYCKALTRLLKEEKPDVTLGYTIKPVVYGAIAAKRAKVKNINSLVTGGGYTFIATSLKARALGKIVRTLYRVGFKKADNVIFQNPDDLNEFCERKLVKREKCSYVNGSGVNLSRFETAPFPNEISFFMLSRFLKSKGVCEYLEAAKIVKSKYPNVKFGILIPELYKIYDEHRDLYLSAPVFMGIESFGDSAINLRFHAETKETDIFAARRRLNEDLLALFRRNGVNIPFPQVVVHPPT